MRKFRHPQATLTCLLCFAPVSSMLAFVGAPFWIIILLKDSNGKIHPQRFFHAQWIPTCLSVVAAIASAVAAWKAYDIAQQQQHDFHNRIQFHFELTEEDTWSVTIFQVSGEAYHLPVITIMPSLYDAEGNILQGKGIKKSLIPQHGYPLPHYVIENLEGEICTGQTVDLCNIATLEFDFYIFGQLRHSRLP